MPHKDQLDEVVDGLVAASRVLVGIAARSIPESADVSMAQLRALVLLGTDGPSNLSTLAAALGVQPSTATRLCDRLVRRRLLKRALVPDNRREVRLELTGKGRDLVDRSLAARRRDLEAILRRIAPADRRLLAGALETFQAAVRDAPEPAWAAGWGGARSAAPAAP